MLLNIVLSLIVLIIALTCLAIALRAFGVDQICGQPLTAETGLSGQRFTRAMAAAALLWGAAVLCILYGAGLLCCAVTRGSVSWEIFRSAWFRWDANHYRQLAEVGYRGSVENGEHLLLVFFPLYPWLVRVLHTVIPNYDAAGLLLSSVCYMGGCCMLARLVTEDFGALTARNALALFSAYPFAFFFGAFYTESLFLLLSVTAFYLIRRHKWLWAGLVSALAALTRMQGVLLAAAGLVEYIAAEQPLTKFRVRDWRGLGRDLLCKVLPLGLVLLGVGCYLYLNYAVAGDPFKFSYYQRTHWYQGFTPLPRCLKIAWTYLTGSLWEEMSFTTWGPDLAVFALSLAAAVFAARHLPPAWAAYAVFCMLLNFSLSWPLSCGRYMACSFPLFVSLAVAFRKKLLTARLAAVAFAIFQGIYLFVFLSGGHVY